MSVIAVYTNILETGTVTLSVGTASTAFPLYRLYDRDVGLQFKPQTTGALTIKIAQSVNPVAIDRVIIPPSHDIAGTTVSISYSSDDGTYTTDTVLNPSASAISQSTLTGSITKEYWKIQINNTSTSLSAIPEIFLSPSYPFETQPLNDIGQYDNVFNVENALTVSGQDRFLEHGDLKRQRIYIFKNNSTVQETNILALNDAWAGSKPFWIFDHTSVWIYGKILLPLDITKKEGIFTFDFNFLEVLP